MSDWKLHTPEGVSDILEYLREDGDVMPWEVAEKPTKKRIKNTK